MPLPPEGNDRGGHRNPPETDEQADSGEAEQGQLERDQDRFGERPPFGVARDFAPPRLVGEHDNHHSQHDARSDTEAHIYTVGQHDDSSRLAKDVHRHR